MAEGPNQELKPAAVSAAGEEPEIEKIKEDIEETRLQMGETIDAIQERLTVPAITENIKNEVTEKVSAAYETTKDAAYETAQRGMKIIMKNTSKLASAGGGTLPLLLIGSGTGLILMRRRKGGDHRTDGRSMSRGSVGKGNGKTRSDSTAQDGSSTLESVTGAATSAFHKVEDAVSSTASKVADAASAGKEKYADYFDRNPMAVGAVAAAVGLVVGLALPLTEKENELLGETAGSLRDRIKEAASETVESVKGSASELLDNIEHGSSASADTGRAAGNQPRT